MPEAIKECDLHNYLGKRVNSYQLREIYDTYMYLKDATNRTPITGVLVYYTKEPTDEVRGYVEMGCAILYNEDPEIEYE